MTDEREMAALQAIDEIENGEAVQYEVRPLLASHGHLVPIQGSKCELDRMPPT